MDDSKPPASDPPAGYKPLFRTSPFLDHNGPFFYRENGDGTFIVGLRIQPKHANARGVAHGGILMTLCDISLGYRTTRSQTPSPLIVTASVKTDFAGSAKIGDWVEAHVDVHRPCGHRHGPRPSRRSSPTLRSRSSRSR
jgi:acyl-coenzyme A thioesterase PaaI-like protein